VAAWPTGAAFTPAAPLRADRTYTASISTAVTDLAGNGLAAAAAWSFATHRRAWGVATLVEHDDSGAAEEPQLALDVNGDGVAAWAQSDGTRTNIWASRYVAGAGWSAAGVIETGNAGDADQVQLGVNAIDPVIAAVWSQSDGTRTNIWSSHFGTAWAAPVMIETTNLGPAGLPRVTLDTAGNALAVWQQSDGTRSSIWSNVYVTGTGWGTAVLVENDNAGSAFAPDVAFDSAGDAVAVWHQSDGTRANIWTNRYTAGVGWGTPALLETTNTGGAFDARVATGEDDSAIAVWYQSDGVRDNVWANRYVDGVGWSGATLLETDETGSAYSPQVGIDDAGHAVAIWYQLDAVPRYSIMASRYVAGTGWQPAERLELDDANHAVGARVVMGADGDAVAVWHTGLGPSGDLWTARYAGGDWGAPRLLEVGAGPAGGVQVAIAPTGDAAAVWTQSDGLRVNVIASSFR